MTTREEIIRHCLTYVDAYEDYPFEEDDWTAMRHKSNKKTFAFIFMREGRIWINLKAEPMASDLWKSVFSAVVPAYHMNKTHWISVILDGSMQDEEIAMLIDASYTLTLPKIRAKGKSVEENEL